jgi:hypothetical protein
LLGSSDDACVEPTRRLAEPVFESRGVDHHPELLVRVLVDVAIVDHQTVGVHERAVSNLPRSDAGEVVRESSLDQPHRIGAGDLVLHGREQIPEPGRRPDGFVLGHRVVTELHGPRPPVLPDDLGARGDLDVMER